MSDAQAWWEDFFPELFAKIQGASRSPERTKAETERILRLLAPPEGSAILDVPCGEGRHALDLARRGFRVTGIELHPGTLDTARDLAREEDLEIRLEEADMRDLRWEDEFDGAFCFWSSFGYFEDEENARFLSAVYRTLKPGARFLIEGHITETLLPHKDDRSWGRVGEAVLLEERTYDHERGRMETDWTLVIEGEHVTRRSSIRLYSYRQLREMLEGVGFIEVEGFDAEQETPFAYGARRLAMVARKPEAGAGD